MQSFLYENIDSIILSRWYHTDMLFIYNKNTSYQVPYLCPGN